MASFLLPLTFDNNRLKQQLQSLPGPSLYLIVALKILLQQLFVSNYLLIPEILINIATTAKQFFCRWASTYEQMHSRKQWQIIVWHMFMYVMTLPGCGSCATLEGRYVLNQSSLININDSGLWSFHCYDGKQWYVCTHCESPGMCSVICQYISRELMMTDLWKG